MDFIKEFHSKIVSLVFAFIVFLFPAFAQCQIGIPLFKNYLIKDYRGHEQVLCVTKDQKGIMYFGSKDGVLEYDGSSWRITPIPKQPHVTALAYDSSNSIYVAAVNTFGRLDVDEYGKSFYKELRQPDDTVDFITHGSSIGVARAKVYFVYRQFIYEFDKVTEKVTKHSPPPDHTFRHTCFVSKDVLYVLATKDKVTRLLMLVENKLLDAPYGDSFQHSASTEFVRVHGNNHAYGSQGKIYIYSPDSGKPPSQIFISPLEEPRHIYYIKDGSYYVISTFGQGAVLTDSLGNVLTKYTVDTFLNDNGIWAITMDNQKNLWFCLNNGITKTETGQNLSTWNKSNGLKGLVYNFEEYEGSLFVSEHNRLLQIDSKGNIQIIRQLGNDKVDYTFSDILNFKIGSESKLLISTAQGIREVDGVKKTMKFISKKPSLFLIQSKKNPNRLYTTENEILVSYIYKNRQWVFEKAWKQISGQFANGWDDEIGNLWLNETKIGKLYRLKVLDHGDIDPLSLTVYSSQHGLPPSHYDLGDYELNNQTILATPDGLIKFDTIRNRFTPFCDFGNQLCDGKRKIEISSLAYDKIKNVIYHVESINSRFNLRIGSFLNGEWIWKESRALNRLPENQDLNALMVGRQECLWLITNEGIFKYGLNNDTKDYAALFRCLVRKVNVSGDSTIFWGAISPNELKAAFNLPYVYNNLEFEFAAPFFDREEETLYSYQLVGNDTAWSTWSVNKRKEYTNLSHGKYLFRVKAKNVYGIESDISQFDFTIQPPWFKTKAAYGGYAILFFGIVALLVRVRTQSLQKEKAELEKIVNNRTNELQNSNKELISSKKELELAYENIKNNEVKLKESNEELMQTLEYLKTAQNKLVESGKLASLGQLTAGIAHEINNPLNFVSGGLQGLHRIHEQLVDQRAMTELERNELKGDMKELMDSMSSGITRTSNIVKSLRMLSSPKNEIPVDARVDLADVLESSLLLFRSTLLSKNIKVERAFQHQSKTRVNESQITQVFVNLLDNAIFAIEQNAGERIIRLETEDVKGQTIVRVTDNGVGIPLEVQKHIFDPFFTTKDVGRGTGLGLSISYNIVQRHNGSLTFESEVSKGTTFTISLPFALNQA